MQRTSPTHVVAEFGKIGDSQGMTPCEASTDCRRFARRSSDTNNQGKQNAWNLRRLRRRAVNLDPFRGIGVVGLQRQSI